LAELPVIDERSGAADTLVVRERIAVLTEALEALPRRCREVVVRCKLQGQSYREAADALGLSEKTVTEHVYRGTQRLGEELHKRGVDSFLA
jgi:RNA polymerase sigma-70 factor (ECF subfamily)